MFAVVGVVVDIVLVLVAQPIPFEPYCAVPLVIVTGGVILLFEISAALLVHLKYWLALAVPLFIPLL